MAERLSRLANVRVVDERDHRAGQPSSAGPDAAQIADLFGDRLRALEGRVAAELERPVAARSATEQLLLDVVRELWAAVTDKLLPLLDPEKLSSEIAGLLGGRPVDDFGIDAARAEAVRDLVRPILRVWFGLGNDPGLRTVLPRSAGGAGTLVVLNRSAATLPVDALAMWSELSRSAGGDRPVCALWDEDVLSLPFLGDAMERLGIFPASAENASALLAGGAVVIAFPEGKAARTRTYDMRYRLSAFDDDFLFGAALDAGADIVPGCIIGNEESTPVLRKLGPMPVTPVFPLAGLLGILPLPVTWRVRVGAPLDVTQGSGSAFTQEAAAGVADQARARMQAMIGESLAQRASITVG